MNQSKGNRNVWKSKEYAYHIQELHTIENLHGQLSNGIVMGRQNPKINGQRV